MKDTIPNRLLAVTLVAVLLLFSPPPLRAGGPEDTVEGLQNVAASGIPEALELQAAFDDINAVLNQINADATFRNNIMKGIELKDTTLLLTTLKSRATRTTVSVDTVDTSRSFLVNLSFTNRSGKRVSLCLSSTRSCGPNNNELASVRVK